MASVIKLYEQLGQLIAKYPEIKNIEVCACGTESRLNVFRDEPDGPVTGLSLEDASFMESYVDYVDNILKELNIGVLSEQHKEYLVQMATEEVAEEEMKMFVQENAVSENKKQYCIDVIIPGIRKEGISFVQLRNELDLRIQSGIEDGKDGYNETLYDYSTEELLDAEKFWDETPLKETELFFEGFDMSKEEIKVILEDGITQSVLSNSGREIDVEIVDVNSDYRDYAKLCDYKDSLYANKQLTEIPYTVANFEDEIPLPLDEKIEKVTNEQISSSKVNNHKNKKEVPLFI